MTTVKTILWRYVLPIAVILIIMVATADGQMPVRTLVLTAVVMVVAIWLHYTIRDTYRKRHK
ncbi:hypothetical protein FC83_GL000208 [Agrilactobacillus composti DSM 18527 = JCM 14202]|uniref:Secreted protein n=1 Tax=Agrilactobacillus composti DSM 18527 = JCM 14202 TaxID=1423734 RepID=A0A0R1XZK7_9LACO|nr:hypothetical protein [Agrilactobacillus composti]KRM32806.1 hypothetical protein FC83_GL000208 [Agrilactobacillus composti DSM 18527 = JCM 14202]